MLVIILSFILNNMFPDRMNTKYEGLIIGCVWLEGCYNRHFNPVFIASN